MQIIQDFIQGVHSRYGFLLEGFLLEWLIFFLSFFFLLSVPSTGAHPGEILKHFDSIIDNMVVGEPQWHPDPQNFLDKNASQFFPGAQGPLRWHRLLPRQVPQRVLSHFSFIATGAQSGFHHQRRKQQGPGEPQEGALQRPQRDPRGLSSMPRQCTTTTQVAL